MGDTRTLLDGLTATLTKQALDIKAAGEAGAEVTAQLATANAHLLEATKQREEAVASAARANEAAAAAHKAAGIAEGAAKELRRLLDEVGSAAAATRPLPLPLRRPNDPRDCCLSLPLLLPRHRLMPRRGQGPRSL